MSGAPVLTIAGSDPSGGAGVQADLRVFAALGVAGLSAVTAITIQNSLGVQSVHPADPDLLARQIAAVLEDTPVGAVKIGMLGGAPQVRAVAEMLRRFRPPNVVLDPVLASTGGVPLLDDVGRATLLEELLPLCDLITPNAHEAAALTGLPVSDLASARRAAEALVARGARSALVKGGHLPGMPTDTLFGGDGHVQLFADARVDTPHTHGVGCFLSAAIAVMLTRRARVADAVGDAKALVGRGLTLPVVVGRGRGYPDVLGAVRTIGAAHRNTHAERLARLRGVYVLTDPVLRPDRSHEEIAAAALAGGARIVQLREKRLTTPALVDLARSLSAMAHETGALCIVNDRVDVAAAGFADGVHLGPDDMHPRDARSVLGPDALIGVSVSSVEEARAVAPYASYLGVGAIYGSSTKHDAGPPVGLDRIREMRAAYPSHPTVAIGGITAGTVGAVREAGADAAAVVSAVVCARHMQAATEELVRRFG